MIKLDGNFGQAKVFTSELEDGAKNQIIRLLNQDFIENSKIRIMPDVHAGMGCVIGFTADMKDKVIPNIVGVDIGCGVLVVKLGKCNIDLERLDEIINNKIPSGFKMHKNVKYKFDKIKELYCYEDLKNIDRINKSIGSLGGGNHFIELSEDSGGYKYLIIHSGSRNLGNQIAKHYQNIAIQDCNDRYDKDLCYLTGENRNKYLHDMKISQEYASLNRLVMANIILEELLNMKLDNFKYFETIHNYINFDDNIIRKGAISAYKDELLLIPINMRDGSILAKGKGNEDWNYSAPHGAGRIMSRRQASEELDLKEFKDDMKDIYTTSVNKRTLDESPKAYNTLDYILENISDTVDVIDILKPIYNYKA